MKRTKMPTTLAGHLSDMMAAAYPPGHPQPSELQAAEVKRMFMAGALASLNMMIDGQASTAYNEIASYNHALKIDLGNRRTAGHA